MEDIVVTEDEDIVFTHRSRILLLCLFIFGMIGAIASFLAFAVFYSVIALFSAILCCLLVWIISLIYKSEEFQRLVIEEAKERGSYKIKNWKENWKWFFVVLAVGIVCFFVLCSPAIFPRLDDFKIALLYGIPGWIYFQGFWAYRIYCSGKDMKAARLLCRAKYEGMTSFRECMAKQIERCKRITGQEKDHMDSPGDLVYEPDWRTRVRLQASVEVNYESWLKKYIESSQEEKEKEDKLWEKFLKTLETEKRANKKAGKMDKL